MCLRGLLKCVESGEGEHPDGGLPRPRPAPGKRRRREQPAPSRDPRLRRPGPIPCARRCFLRLTRREGRGGKDPCGCPLPITNTVVSCRWLPHFLSQLTQRLSTLWKWVPSEPRHQCSPRGSTATPGGIRIGDPALYCFQSSLTPQPVSSQGQPERGEGWGRTCRKESGALLVLKSWAP